MASDLAAAELAYQQSASQVDILHKEEDARRLRARNLVLRDDVDNLNDKLWEEQERGEEAEVDAEEWQSRAEESHSNLLRFEAEVITKTRELETAQIELASLKDISSNSQQLLQEKLSLARELDQIKPELEHLRSTTTSNKGLLAEKLTLERELNNMRVELESERDSNRQLRDRESQTHKGESQRSSELETVRKELAKAQRELARAEKKSDAGESKRIKELEQELLREVKAREAAEESAKQHDDEIVADLEKQLEKEREKRKKLMEAGNSQIHGELDEIRHQLAEEQRERQHIEKEYRKLQADYEADKAVLEDKLDQFRNKLRSTKEKLRDCQIELAEARNAAAAKPLRQSVAVSKKRSAPEVDPDAAIGTPGDRPTAKRSKRGSSAVTGEKSTFSITPFLNKTTNVLDSPATHNPDEPIASIEDIDSPSVIKAAKTPSAVEKPVKPLGIASPGKSNLKVKQTETKRKRTARASSLEQVTEEAVEEVEEAQAEVSPSPQKTEKGDAARGASLKPQLKARKSLSTFASFREGSLPPQPLQQKKKRKLGGGGMKTIFDEDEDAEQPLAPSTARAFGGQRTLGGFGALGGGLNRMSGLGQKKKGPLTTTDGGFQFSPLKRNRGGSVRPN